MTASLSVIVPNSIGDAQLVSSTVPENDYAAYNPATTYALGARCISATTHMIYESLQAGNIGHDPTIIESRSGTLIYWAEVGPTNRWAIFDGEVSTQTSVASPLTVVLRPGGFNALHFAAIDAEHISVTVKDSPGGSVIYSFSSDLEGSAPADYDEYFFDPFIPLTSLTLTEIDQYSNPELTVTLTSVSSPVKCGALSIGGLRALGKTLTGATVEPKSYSRVKTDENGKTTIKKGKAAKDMTATAIVDISQANSVVDILAATMGVPCVWIGSDSMYFSALSCYGLGTGKVSYDQALHVTVSLTVQGMI